MAELKHTRVKVPATTANMGPGFDCLGMALDMWNEVRVDVGELDTVSITGQGAEELPSDRTNLVYRSMERLFREAARDVPPLRLHCHNEIPLKRGLGSSAAAIAGGLVAARDLLRQLEGPAVPTFTQSQLLDIAVEEEGHPDNLAPALLGGCQLVVDDGGSWMCSQVPLPPDLHAVLFIPDAPVATDQARAALPSTVSMEDAVYNLGRVGLLVNALAGGRLDELQAATGDRLHQPYRQRLFPAMKVIFSAAIKGGAQGVFLSGSGSTILALTRGREMTVAYEMAEAARQAGVEGSVKITRSSPLGTHLTDGEYAAG